MELPLAFQRIYYTSSWKSIISNEMKNMLILDSPRNEIAWSLNIPYTYLLTFDTDQTALCLILGIFML